MASIAPIGYRLPRHQEDSPPTTSPPSKVTSAHGLKNEEYTSFGGELVGGEIPWWRGDWIPSNRMVIVQSVEGLMANFLTERKVEGLTSAVNATF